MQEYPRKNVRFAQYSSLKAWKWVKFLWGGLL